MQLTRFVIVLIVLVVDLCILVECQQKQGAGNKRTFSEFYPSQYQYRPQYHNNNPYQWSQGWGSNGPQNQWQFPQNQWKPWGSNWGSGSGWGSGAGWGSGSGWGPSQSWGPSASWGPGGGWGSNQLPHIPQLSPQFGSFPKPSLGHVLDSTLDIIKKTQQALQFIPRKDQ
ncbi:unnamed protein product [Diabrotica balteata]|uniref:Uncharacterized protein n=1 Tax=Diabrotica balteata TaxID=107213 RepID=A0A9N9TAI6_DIABA|nr:unnamed protein product [Diabrotica balteata]